MSQTYLAYKREDEARVARIAEGLRRCGIDLWWDRELPGGESWRETLTERLDRAACVVVIWSHESTGPANRYVLDEARRGMERDVLVPVLLDTVTIPLGFGEIQAIDLTRWKGGIADPFFQDLVAAITAKVTHSPAPAPRGPMARLRRRLTYSAISGAGMAALIAFSVNALGTATTVCLIPGPQPALSDACGTVGLGGRPSQAERLAWARLPRGSCAALREHVRRFPNGAYRSQAADLIEARRVTTIDRWQPTTRSLILYEPASGAAAPSETAAHKAALVRSTLAAERICRGFGSGTLFRYDGATGRADRWNCERDAGGYVCSFDGFADCALHQRQQIERESCGAS